MSEHVEDALAEGDGALVHWMERPAPRISPGALSSLLAGAFLAGASVGLVLGLLTRRLTPDLRHHRPVARWLH